MGVENKTSCWESETMNRHSAGPGGSEASDELSSRLFVLRRLMWIQMDRSREGTECASIFTRVCLSLPDTDTRRDRNSWMACRFFLQKFSLRRSCVWYNSTCSYCCGHVSVWGATDGGSSRLPGLRYEVSSCRSTPMQYKTMQCEATGRMIK